MNSNIVDKSFWNKDFTLYLAQNFSEDLSHSQFK